MGYAKQIQKILPRDLHRLFLKLQSPDAIQDYLDTLPINFEPSGETNLSPYQVFTRRTAHCFEGAVFAAAALAFHGQKPLLMDFATAYDDEDHTVALFKVRGKWGAISKTNHAVLKYRDPLYQSPRELAMSYFHEFYLWDGRKSMRAYSAPFDLSRFTPEKWITSEESLDWLMARLSQTRYFPVVAKNYERRLRRASDVERRALSIVDFPDPRTKRRG
ncbi:MAG TPA: hypothetical protein VNM40_01475 [Candidatus Paceibacterota bacterium]|nr:hypothetical protein [Candidatus Paceibacterota bacterium]